MLTFQSVEEAFSSGFTKCNASHFDSFKGFELVSVPMPQHGNQVVDFCLVASAIYAPLLLDVHQLEIDGCAKFEHLQESQLRDHVFGTAVHVLVGAAAEVQEAISLYSPTNLLKAIQAFREAVDLFYVTWPAAKKWEDARIDALHSLESGKAAKSRNQSIRYAQSICKKFGFENLEAKYQKILKDNGLA